MEIQKISRNEALQEVMVAVSEKLASMKSPLPSMISEKDNLKVVDLEALAGKLGIEASDARDKSMKTTLASVFTIVISLAEETMNVSEGNMAQLKIAKQLSDELAAIDAELNELMNSQVKIDNGIEAKKKRVKKLQMELEQYEKELQQEGADIEAINQKIANAQAQLSATEAEIAALQAQLSDVKSQISSLNEAKSSLESRLNQALSSIKDVNVLTALANALKIDAADLIKTIDDVKAVRGKEEEKWLDENSPVRIIQDAINRHDLEMLDDISSNKKEKV